jgi:GAF domain-containing protein
LPFRTPGKIFTDTSAAARLAAVQRLVRGAVPSLADFSLVYLARTSTIRCIAAAHTTATGARLLRALVRAYRVRRSDRDSTVAEVIRTARPVVRTDIATELAWRQPTGTERDTIADLHRRLATRSALAVPVMGAGTVLGALSLCYSQSDRSYSARDIAMAMRLAARIGRALTGVQGIDATVRLRAAARNARQGPTLRRRMAARDQI